MCPCPFACPAGFAGSSANDNSDNRGGSQLGAKTQVVCNSAHSVVGDTDRCQQIPSVTFDWGGFTAVRAFLPTCLLTLLSILLSNPHQLDSLLPPAEDHCKRGGEGFNRPVCYLWKSTERHQVVTYLPILSSLAVKIQPQNLFYMYI